MAVAAKSSSVRVDQFFTVAEARFDRWRSLLQAARDWEGAAATQARSEIEKHSQAVSGSLLELRPWEDFFAYPGQTLLRTLDERIEAGDATGTTRLVQAISTALLTHSYRRGLGDREADE